MKTVNNIVTPAGTGQLVGRQEDGTILVRLSVSDETAKFPERLVTKGEFTGIWWWHLEELK